MRFSLKHGGSMTFTRQTAHLDYRGIELKYKRGYDRLPRFWWGTFKGMRSFMRLVDHYYGLGIEGPEYIAGLITDRLDRDHRKRVLEGSRTGHLVERGKRNEWRLRPRNIP